METQDDIRKPLVAKNGLTKLPLPSKLRLPGPVKRAMSPEMVRPTKRTKLDNSVGTLLSKSYAGSLPSCNFKNNNASEKSKPTGVATRTTAVVRPTTKSANLVPSTSKASTRSKNDSSNAIGFKKPVSSSVPKAPTGGKKRPAWDLKGRLQDMEEVLASRNNTSVNLQTQLGDYNQRIMTLESQNSHLSGTVAQAEQETSQATAEINELHRKLREAADNHDSMKRKLQQELDDISFTTSTLERQKESLNGELTAAQLQINGFRSSVAQLTSAQAGLSAELDVTKLNLEQAVKENRIKDEEIASLKQTLKEREETIDDYNGKFREHETVRRKLHNTIQELKGNIRVFCRVRPLIGEELVGTDGVFHHMNFPDMDQKTIELEKLGEVSMNESSLAGNRRGNKYDFIFDRVFQPCSTQKEVFEEISQLVQSALDGYNVCIFAYGQTGSGKTFTMQGPDLNAEETTGMIPRSVAQIFEAVRELQTKGWKYDMEAFFLEIYNETIRDLLGNGKEEKNEIKLNGPNTNDVMVSNLTLVNITSEDQIHNLLIKASENRAVAETKCNEHSSRSHSVFRLKLMGTNQLTGETCQGTLNLVDLAGSERLKESGSEGQRLKETLCINKSLSNLGNVIMALANKDSHIPYRNSKLTYLLQNSLGGNSKTLMFVNVSPREDNFQETLNSLRFATKVNNCNIGTAQKKSK